MRTTLFCLFAISTLIFGGCPPKTTTPSGNVAPTYDNTFTITGGTFNNKLYNFVNVSYSAGGYNTTGNNNIDVNLKGTNDSAVALEMDVTAHGSSAGKYTIKVDPTNVDNDFVILYINGIQYLAVANSGNITISTFGPKGGDIKGSFNCKFTDGTNSFTATGNFKAVRAQ